MCYYQVMKDKQDFQNTRQYYRIRYPLSYRPKVRIQGKDSDHDVIELSERGVRFLYKGTGQYNKGAELQVHLVFHDGESIKLSGELLRVEKEDLILHFQENIPLSRIMKEQRYLRSHIIGHM